MYNIAICDDDTLFSGILEQHLASNYVGMLNIDVFSNGKKLIEAVNKSNSVYNIIFLDLSMPEIDGIELGRKLRETLTNLHTSFIIYISSYDTTATSINGIHPYAYLKKPLNYDELDEIFETILSKMKDFEDAFSFSTKKGTCNIPYNSIIYAENIERSSIIHATDNDYVCSVSLSKISPDLEHHSNAFVRIHVSYLINLMYLEQLNGNEVILKDGTVLPVSRRYKKDLLARVSEILLNH